MPKKLFLISIDSMVTEDIGIMSKLPNFVRIIKDSSMLKNVITTYPSLTHSVHTSIMTGCNPGTHGVINNELLQPENEAPHWFDYADQCKAETIWEVFRKNGKTCALVFYPVTVGADVEWNIHRPGVGGPHKEYKDAEAEMVATSTPGIYTGKLYERCHPSFCLQHYYDWDDFACKACAQLIDDHEPDLVMTHITVIDAIRHSDGVFSKKLTEAYEFLDPLFGEIWEVFDRKNLWDDYIICFTADHGHLDINKVAFPNVLFKQLGYIRTNEDGSLKDWDIFCHGSGCCMPVYAKTPEFADKAREILNENREKFGIGEILEKDYLEEHYGLKGDFAFFAETDGGTAFRTDWNGNSVELPGAGDYRSSRATHGHMPEKGVKPMMFFRSPDSVGNRVIVQQGYIIDEAPTLARLCGYDMPNADGKPIKEFLL